MQSKTKKILLAIGCIVLVIAILGGIKAMQIKAMIDSGKTFVMPPEAVTATTVAALEWQRSLTAVGSVVAVRGTTIGAELGGTVKQIAFESGTRVKAGSLLVKLDSIMEEAQLASAKANADLATVNLNRAQQLRKANANSQSELDAAEAQAKQAEAAVANVQAAVAKKVIRAPFDGVVGIRQVDLGQILSPGAPIATLENLDSVYAEFSFPQQALSEIAVGQDAHVTSDTFPGQTWHGKISAINPGVDVATRNVRIQALFENPEGKLRPGMFVNVEVSPPGKSGVLTIPSSAVMYAPYGDSVYVVEDGKDSAGKKALVARQTFVRLGEKRGDLVSVISGIKPGETVVTTGAFKLHNGSTVVVNNELAPKTSATPTPSDK